MSHRLTLRKKKVEPRIQCPTGMVKDPDYPESGTPCILAPTRSAHSRYPVGTPYASKQPSVPSRLYGHEAEGHEYNYPARGLTRIEPAGYEGREYGAAIAATATRNRKKIKRMAHAAQAANLQARRAQALQAHLHARGTIDPRTGCPEGESEDYKKGYCCFKAWYTLWTPFCTPKEM